MRPYCQAIQGRPVMINTNHLIILWGDIYLHLDVVARIRDLMLRRWSPDCYSTFAWRQASTSHVH